MLGNRTSQAPTGITHTSDSATVLPCSCCVVVNWAVVFCITIKTGWNGSLFYAPCLAHQ